MGADVVLGHHDSIVTGAMAVNVWDVIEHLKAIVVGGRAIDPSRLDDPGIPLDVLAG